MIIAPFELSIVTMFPVKQVRQRKSSVKTLCFLFETLHVEWWSSTPHLPIRVGNQK